MEAIALAYDSSASDEATPISKRHKPSPCAPDPAAPGRPLSSTGTSESPDDELLLSSESVLLAKDVVLHRGMPLRLQQRLSDELGACSFFAANNEKTRHVDMCHLGWHEAAGGKLRFVAPIPPIFAAIAAAAHRLAVERHCVLRSVPLICADVAVVNGYKRAARLGMHVDRRSTRHPAIPVVAISLGETAEVCRALPSQTQKACVLTACLAPLGCGSLFSRRAGRHLRRSNVSCCARATYSSLVGPRAGSSTGWRGCLRARRHRSLRGWAGGRAEVQTGGECASR